MYLPIILLRLWGWPGFWAFFIPNVIGCAAFGFILDAKRSRALAQRLGWMCALFSAVTIAYQCYFAGWTAQYFVVSSPDAVRTVAATGIPIVMLIAALWLAVRGNAFWRTAGTVVTVLSLWVILLPGGVDPALSSETPPNGSGAINLVSAAGATPLLGSLSLLFALPTIVAGFLLSPYFDLTFHRAAQEAPSPRIAFLTFGLTFAAMLLLVASFYDPSTGEPRIGVALCTLWGVQLLFTVAVHLRELLVASPEIRMPSTLVGGLTAGAVLLATPSCMFTLGPMLGSTVGPALESGNQSAFSGSRHILLAGEPVYLGFLGAYGLLFPLLFLMERAAAPRSMTVVLLATGVPCYLYGAFDFQTYFMPIPIVMGLLAYGYWKWNSLKRPAY